MSPSKGAIAWERLKADPERHTEYKRKANEKAKKLYWLDPQKYRRMAKVYKHRHRANNMTRSAINYLRVRREVIEAYGGKCACCGESEFVFLAIDHKYNDGALQRKTVSKVKNAGTSFMYLIRRLGYPDEYQVLCHNCNWAKYRGGCPHLKAREQVG